MKSRASTARLGVVGQPIAVGGTGWQSCGSDRYVPYLLGPRDHYAMEIEVARDWVDYVQAGGVLVSLVVAFIALVYAKKSADSAADSSAAAETTATAAAQEAEQTRELVDIARDQHARLLAESSRRPVFEPPALEIVRRIDPSQLTVDEMRGLNRRPNAMSGLRPVLVRASFQNVGDKAADRTLAHFIVPAGVSFHRSSATGQQREVVDLHQHEVELDSPVGDAPAYGHSWRIPTFPPFQPEALHALLIFQAEGEYEVELAAAHEEASPMSQRFLIRIRPDFEAVVPAPTPTPG